MPNTLSITYFTLQGVKAEAKRATDLLATVDKPANCLASALVSRDTQITELLQEKRKLENKLRKLYECTKELAAERKAMLVDVQQMMHKEQVSRWLVTKEWFARVH